MSTIYSPAVPPLSAMQMVQSPRMVRSAAHALLATLILSLAGMLLIPWQQTTKGTGRVVAYFPTERPQTVQSPIYGRIERWGEGIVEGVKVSEGDLIAVIRDIDTERAKRLADQVAATSEKRRFAELKAATYGRQVLDLVEAREMVMQANRELIEEAKRKVAAEEQALLAAQAAERQTKSNTERQQRLFEQGFTSGVNAEIELRKYEEAVAKVKAAEEYLSAAKNYQAAKVAELEQKAREAQTKVDYARAMQQEALGEAQLTTKELVELQGKQAQFASREIRAPRDGYILRLFANEEAEMLKEGDPLFTIVPETSERAAELMIDGNDIPLVTVGREVRLQFEGYPAVQFAAGWPEVAAGTFAGQVVAMDATDDGLGKFRVLVRPIAGEPWPDDRFLRQGVRVNGWVLLNRVTLGYELWRQLNGFPPVYGGESKGGTDKDVKKVKLPK
ncbi:MAG: HlyD family efflux transporter periplasmic adaptor subunit [Pirellulaceae bacterium]|nr:HlyD family efflux transporter periplasmic adaptor subunit [Pirellulaceae bacterium]